MKKSIILALAVLAVVFFALILDRTVTDHAVGPAQKDAANSGVWKAGDYWTVKMRHDASRLSGIQGDVSNVLLRFEVIKKEGSASTSKKGLSQAAYSFVLRETMILGGNSSKELYYMGNVNRSRIYMSVTDYSVRGRPRTLEERYSYPPVDTKIVSPSLASALSCRGCKYIKKDASYAGRLLAEKNVNMTRLDKEGIYAIVVYDGAKEVSTHVLHDLLPWPIYEKIDESEYFLIDYP
jgi:hypothetical protein